MINNPCWARKYGSWRRGLLLRSCTNGSGIHRTARVFTEAEQAQNHCQVGNQGLAIKVILDWLDQAGGRTAA